MGGSQTNYNRAKPLFDVLGKISVHVGDVGAGSSAKLAINYFLGLTLQGLAESVLYAEKNGISRKDMLTIVNEGACGSAITKLKTESIQKDSFPPTFALKHLVKDLRLAKETGLDAALSDPLFDSFKQALQEGLGEEDVMAILKSLAKK